MAQENEFEKLELILRGTPDMEKYNREILACIKDIRKRTMYRLFVPVMDGKADPREYKSNLFAARDQADLLARAIEFRNIELNEEKRTILLQEILNLISEGMHIHEQFEYNNQELPITEIFKVDPQDIASDSYLHYHYWILLTKSVIIKKVRDEAAFYNLPLDKIITNENDKEGISGLWEKGDITSEAPYRIKIKWKGLQKEIAELVLELEKKGWIGKIEDGYRMEICRTLLSVFDISNTQKNDDTDVVGSFYKIMKPNTDPKTKAQSYPQVYTKLYKTKFDSIKINSN
jgi:hypothetical protein